MSTKAEPAYGSRTDRIEVPAATLKRPRGGTFRALVEPNYRKYLAGSFVSNIGTWMQRVAQDWLVISLNTRKEGPDAASVQAQLKAALEAALAVARPAAREGQMAVRTGSIGLHPRYNRDGKISGWQGSTELVLEGTDFGRITTTAGQTRRLISPPDPWCETIPSVRTRLRSSAHYPDGLCP